MNVSTKEYESQQRRQLTYRQQTTLAHQVSIALSRTHSNNDRQTDLQFRDARGQHHGEESDEEVAVLPQSQVRLAAQLLETKHGDTHPVSKLCMLSWNGK